MSPEEEQAATASGETIKSDTDAKPDKATSGDVEDDADVAESDNKEVGDTQTVPEETFDAENKSSDADSVSKQGAEGETVDSEMEAKKGGEDEKMEEKAEKAAADSTSTVKESSSVEGDDQKKRFVAFCLLENQNGYLCCIGSFVLEKIGCSFGGKNVLCISPFAFVIPYSYPTLLPISI